METKIERIDRILASGEVSGHCHVVVGDDVVITRNIDGEIFVEVGNEGAVLRHILETPWVDEGIQEWTKEHYDIQLNKGRYEFIQQIEYNPYKKTKLKQVNVVD